MPSKEYYLKNKHTQIFKNKKKESDKKYRLKNIEKLKISKKLYYQKVKNTESYKEKRRISDKLYNKTPKRMEYNRLLKSKNYKKDKERQAIYWINNPESFKQREIWAVLKRRNTTRLGSTLTLLGVNSVETVIKHIEKQFKNGMTWNNHGEWHLDHIKPCASFDLTCPVQQLACFNYKNLQPLEAFENMSKGAKII